MLSFFSSSTLNTSMAWCDWLQDPLDACEPWLVPSSVPTKIQWQVIPWDTTPDTLTEALQRLGFETLAQWHTQAQKVHHA
ncbi:MAG: hypothetical protein ACKO37_10245, partial [Vampirovibrionales bacterium]